jgi:hypothetical protein
MNHDVERYPYWKTTTVFGILLTQPESGEMTSPFLLSNDLVKISGYEKT